MDWEGDAGHREARDPLLGGDESEPINSQVQRGQYYGGESVGSVPAGAGNLDLQEVRQWAEELRDAVRSALLYYMKNAGYYGGSTLCFALACYVVGIVLPLAGHDLDFGFTVVRLLSSLLLGSTRTCNKIFPRSSAAWCSFSGTC